MALVAEQPRKQKLLEIRKLKSECDSPLQDLENTKKFAFSFLITAIVCNTGL
jgi:hypothetical protein